MSGNDPRSGHALGRRERKRRRGARGDRITGAAPLVREAVQMAPDAGHEFPLPPRANRGKCCRLDLLKNLSRVARAPVRSGSPGLVSPVQLATPDSRFRSRRAQSPQACSPSSKTIRMIRRPWRNFAADNRSHKPCEAKPEHRLESVANVQTDTDLHVRRRVSNRTDEKSLKRRDGIRNTRGGASRNGIDFVLRGRRPPHARHKPRRASRRNDKILNLREDSNRSRLATIPRIVQNKFIKNLRSIRRRRRFASAVDRYADKAFAGRAFS